MEDSAPVIEEKVKAGRAMLVDVRTLSEWQEAHACDATLLPLNEMLAGRIPDVGKDTPIYLYCRTGSRSELAKKLLEDRGYHKVINVGGLHDWQLAGGCVT